MNLLAITDHILITLLIALVLYDIFAVYENIRATFTYRIRHWSAPAAAIPFLVGALVGHVWGFAALAIALPPLFVILVLAVGALIVTTVNHFLRSQEESLAAAMSPIYVLLGAFVGNVVWGSGL